MSDDSDAERALAGLSDDPFYGRRCKFCLSVFHLDKDNRCTQPDCVAKASRERTEVLLQRIRDTRTR